MSRDDSSSLPSSIALGSPSSSPSTTPGLGPSSPAEKDPDVIVIDIGTGSIKAGWSGEDAPRVVIPTLLLDHHGQAMPATVIMDQHHIMERNEFAVGHAALQALHLSSTRLANTTSNNLNLLKPVDRGEITDYETCQKILDYIFKNELRVNPKDHPVMLTVSPLCSPESRAELAKLMFDVFNVPSLCMANQAVLSLYSTGRTTGIVLEVGEGMTYCVPIYEGFALKHAVLSIPVAGGDITKYLMKSLGERGFNFLDSQADVVRDIKEKLCRVRPTKQDYAVLSLSSTNGPSAATAVTPSNSATGGAAVTDVDETSYELPDGQMIRLDDFCRFHTLEILFQPDSYAQSLGVTLTGGLNQSWGIPPQPNPSMSTALGGLGTSSNNNASSMMPPSSALALPGQSSASNPPASASSMSSYQQQRSGPITIDLSTNELIGVHQMLYMSLQMVDAFLRKELLKNIILAGGTSMSKGFGDRVKRELALLLMESGQGNGTYEETAAGLNIITDSQRKYAAWIGASMYASLPTFSIIKITADHYKRDENSVHKKFF